jgi:hypothetical protein
MIMFAGMDDLDTITAEERDAIFARVYVEQRALKKGNAAEIACVRAGITSPELNMSIVASRQLARPEVQRLIMAAEASGVDVERREYTRDLFLDELQAVVQAAMDKGAYPSAISAVKTQAQLLGMLDQTVNVNHSVSAKDLDLATLRAMVADRARPVNVIEGTLVRGIGDDDDAI